MQRKCPAISRRPRCLMILGICNDWPQRHPLSAYGVVLKPGAPNGASAEASAPSGDSLSDERHAAPEVVSGSRGYLIRVNSRVEVNGSVPPATSRIKVKVSPFTAKVPFWSVPAKFGNVDAITWEVMVSPFTVYVPK